MQTAYKFNVEQTKPWVSDCSTVINVRTNQTTGLRFGSEENCAKFLIELTHGDGIFCSPSSIGWMGSWRQ